ncbi:WD40 repeat-like protein [Mycena floridula]|nr:WD40 repeat-like protein [Mycena floridula]
MRLHESDQDSTEQGQAGPSSLPGPSSNGHPLSPTLGNGLVSNGIKSNGSTSVNGTMGNGVVAKHGKSPITRVSLPGTKLYDDSDVDREEFIRLVIQSLRDVGYSQSAATLEAESGYTMEAHEVSEFRQYVLDGFWTKAEAALLRLGVDDEDVWEARFLIYQQKYLELLEAQKTTAALLVLRNELAPLNVDSDQLHSLSSLIMCSEPEDLRQRAGWEGVAGGSRQNLLDNLHRYIPSSVMIPQHRFAILLSQARSYQRQRCVFHNTPLSTSSFSLYTDHQCDRGGFPNMTTIILEGHKDEVWNIEWSHDGVYLASASKDKTAIIWKIGPDGESSSEFLTLRDHPYAVGCIAWSKDDSIILTSAENHIKVWNAKTGVCLREIEQHSETVTALAWLPDGSGFISAALDRKILVWDPDGKQMGTWGLTAIRITDLAVTPDLTRLVTVGMDYVASGLDAPSSQSSRRSSSSGTSTGEATGSSAMIARNNHMIVYDFATKQIQTSIPLDDELTSVKVSRDSQFALVNNAPHEIHLWDLQLGKLVRKYTGQRQGHHVIRSCFGGVDGNFVVSGSEDRNVYVWDRDTGTLLEVLSGHGEGSVNSVAWNPRNMRMFASCSDDNTIRIWEPSSQLTEPSNESTASTRAESPTTVIGKGKGKTRRWG